MTEKTQNPKRTYPEIYEKFIPLALGLLVVIVIAMLLFTVLVGVGMLNFN